MFYDVNKALKVNILHDILQDVSFAWVKSFLQAFL